MDKDSLKLTERQAEALEARLYGEGHWMRRRGTLPDGRILWDRGRSMGGATARMADGLQSRGLLSFRVHDEAIRKEFEAWDNQLTAKGARALEAYWAAKKIDSNDERMAKVREAIPELEKRETDIAAALAEKKALKQAEGARRNAERRTAHMAELRKRMAAHGLEEFASAKSDEELLDFARDIEGAEFAS